jgi:hypothetical protein
LKHLRISKLGGCLVLKSEHAAAVGGAEITVHSSNDTGTGGGADGKKS